MRIIHLALVLALVVLAAPAWGADLDRWFHVSWDQRLTAIRLSRGYRPRCGTIRRTA